MAHTTIKMAENTAEDGKTIKNMVMVCVAIKMAHLNLVCGKMAKNNSDVMV
jgi:hypothetical protein